MSVFLTGFLPQIVRKQRFSKILIPDDICTPAGWFLTGRVNRIVTAMKTFNGIFVKNITIDILEIRLDPKIFKEIPDTL
jgi:hypothetical protein